MSEFPPYVCRNPSCPSVGHSHPNCQCGPPVGMAKGGSVEHFCSRNLPHKKGCQYFAEGGSVGVAPLPQFQEDPESTLDHVGAESGLLGVLKQIGRIHSSFEKEKHNKVLQDAKDQHALRRNPIAGFEPRKQVGHRLGDNIANGDYEKAADNLAGHPLTGTISPSKLKPIMERMAQPVLDREPNSEAFRGSVNYLSSSMRGQNKLDNHVGNLFDDKFEAEEPEGGGIQELKSHIDSMNANPQQLIDVGGSIGHYLPMHGAALGAKTATALNYLGSLKPVRTQTAPLDPIGEPDKIAENNYDRQLGIANNPLSILKHVKEGTVQSKDLQTLNNIYPKLADSLKRKAFEKLVDHRAKGNEVPYRYRQGLSMLLGQAMDLSMTSQGMQAIINSQRLPGPPQQQPQSKSGKATKVELDQINKVDSLSELGSESRQIEKRV